MCTFYFQLCLNKCFSFITVVSYDMIHHCQWLNTSIFNIVCAFSGLFYLHSNSWTVSVCYYGNTVLSCVNKRHPPCEIKDRSCLSLISPTFNLICSWTFYFNFLCLHKYLYYSILLFHIPTFTQFCQFGNVRY